MSRKSGTAFPSFLMDPSRLPDGSQTVVRVPPVVLGATPDGTSGDPGNVYNRNIIDVLKKTVC